MTYETFLSLIEKTSRVKICDVINVLDNLYQQAMLSDDAIDEYYKIYDLVDLIFQKNIFIGDDDDYHNIAVVCAKHDDYDVACRFIDKGLHHYPYNIDLLADCLKYGIKCGRNEQCKDIYKNLLLRKADWNWRAYRFAIDYLFDLTSIDSVDRNQEIISLIKDFQSHLPEEEDSYLVEAEYLKNSSVGKNNLQFSQRTFLSVLEYATSDESPVKRTPKCDLKLADFYYKNGTNIDKALKLLERCKKDSIEVQRSVNRSYVYLLSALCKMTQYYDFKDKFNDEDKDSFVRSIYQDYHIASIETTDSRVRDCRKLVESFIRETEIPYPYDDAVNNMIY